MHPDRALRTFFTSWAVMAGAPSRDGCADRGWGRPQPIAQRFKFTQVDRDGHDLMGEFAPLEGRRRDARRARNRDRTEWSPTIERTSGRVGDERAIDQRRDAA